MADITLAALDDLAIHRAKSGDLAALERVYRAYEGTVYTLARRICRSPEDAEEVMQETFLEVCRSFKKFRGTGPGSLTAWIKRIASSKALIRIRYEKYRQTEEFLEDSGWAGRLDGDTGLQMDLEGFTHEEIAEQMSKTVSFSKSQLSRAHARLRKMLGEEAQC
jgi:RNA polymerase sigma-70 factor (ECF subfamily)